MMLIITLLMGMLMSISANSWLGVWMGLEINLLSFIPLMINHENILTMEASMKYFIIQAMASSLLLFIIISLSMTKFLPNYMNLSEMSMIINTPLALKSGMAPFHWWFPSVMEGLSWINCLLLMTIQKIAPLIIFSYSMSTMSMIIYITMSTIVGSIGGFNQTSVRKILTYSSINHTGWMLSAMMIGENMWLMYFIIYSFTITSIILLIKPLKISFINQFNMMNKSNEKKIFMFTLLLSLGGLPPFLGFLPKWIIIQFMTMNNMILIITLMIIMSLVTLFYYLRLCYSIFMINYETPSWNIQENKDFMTKFYPIMILTSIMGLMLCTMLINVL
uniref:NADH-ubiquinone oxidoreductase chain 2 n=1 Tax=Lamproblatta sp. LA male TaxID=2093468 RepID=A0A2P1H9H7_9NEOP|nr:NADH dehydrogenase subunit 2 [Lamproblatta sp. LA male]